MKKRILIRNGMVYDPIVHAFTVRDLAMEDGILVPDRDFGAEKIIDAENCIVTPGLIDFHVHVQEGSRSGLHDIDVFCIPNGTTTCVDAGTAGIDDIEELLHDTEHKMTRVFALLHFAREGQMRLPAPENQDPHLWDIGRMKELIGKYQGRIAGMKLRQQDTIQDPYGLGTEHIRAGAAAEEELGRHLVVHVNNPSGDVCTVAELLGENDVYCHMYSGTRENIIAQDGHVKPGIRAARKRGVLFDACNGRSNFLFRVAIPAIRDGFLPDIISSDINSGCYYEQPLTTLPRLLSKYMALGMSLEQVLCCATITPAKWLGREDLASLEPGTAADIAIFRLMQKETVFEDWQGDRLIGRERLVPQMTIKSGSIAYCHDDFL